MKIHSSTSGSGGFDQEPFKHQKPRRSLGLQERVFAEYIWIKAFASVAKSVRGADSFLARIMTHFLKILSHWIQLTQVISWHKTWQLHWIQWAASIWTQVHSPVLTVYSLHCNKRIRERKLWLRTLLKNVNLVFTVSVWALIIKPNTRSVPLCAGKAVPLRDETGDSG